MGQILTKNQLKDLWKTGEFTDEEFQELVLNSTPSLWAETYLHDPDNKEKPLALHWYQKLMLDEPHRMKCLLFGRGAGKSVSLCANMLWDVITEPGVKIFYYIPGKSQLERLYEILENMIANSPKVANEVVEGSGLKETLGKRSAIEHTIQFKNGSRIVFFICSSNIEKIRSHHNGKIIIDEAHYIKQEALDAITGVIVNTQNPYIIQASTPRGPFGNFYQWAQDSRVNTYHVRSSQSPNWTAEKEAMARVLCPDEATYKREYDALFGTEHDSVYQMGDIDDAVRRSSRTYGLTNKKTYGELYTNFLNADQLWAEYLQEKKRLFIGVDWNSPANGVQIVYLVETANELAVARIDTIANEQFTQLKAVETILCIWEDYRPNLIYVDIGYGSSQVEIIQQKALAEDNKHLYNSFKAIDFTAKIELAAPFSGTLTEKEEEKKVKVRVKNHMISLIGSALKSGNFVLPAFEDEKSGLLTEMRAFKLDRMGENQEPIYSKGGGQHKHMALALAMYAKYCHTQDLNTVPENRLGVLTAHLKDQEAINNTIFRPDNYESRVERSMDPIGSLDGGSFRNPFSGGRRSSRREDLF